MIPSPFNTADLQKTAYLAHCLQPTLSSVLKVSLGSDLYHLSGVMVTDMGEGSGPYWHPL